MLVRGFCDVKRVGIVLVSVLYFSIQIQESFKAKTQIDFPWTFGNKWLNVDQLNCNHPGMEHLIRVIATD